MQEFKRHLSHDEVKAACATAGYQFDDEKYLQGSDFMRIVGQFGDKEAAVIYADWNGRFFGATSDGIKFSSDRDEHDGQPWFDAMLAFFYVPGTGTVATTTQA